ncbi:MAG: hypothetical protein JNK29_08795 [Anaerolineales bacterium]|nr:hypothetical protein [Anaerolineales bacterium]
MQSPTPSPFTSVVGLGPQKSQHPLRASNRWTNVGCGAVSLLAAPVLGGLALYIAWDTLQRYGPARLDNEIGTILVMGAFGLGALLLGAYMLYSGWKSWGSAAALYESGFAYVDRQGLQQVRWDQIEAVWQAITKHYRNGIYTGTTHIYTIKTKDNRRLVLDDKFDKVEELGTAVQRGATQALYPHYAQAVQNGQRVAFGPLALDAQGLYSGDKTLAWKDIKAVKLDRGNLSIKKEGGWFSWATVTVPQIPNFFIFYDLLGRFTKIE